MWGEPAAAEASLTLHQPEARRAFSGGVVPGSRDPGSGGLHMFPGRWVWISDMCLHTGFLVATAAALVSQAHLWGPRF